MRGGAINLLPELRFNVSVLLDVSDAKTYRTSQESKRKEDCIAELIRVHAQLERQVEADARSILFTMHHIHSQPLFILFDLIRN